MVENHDYLDKSSSFMMMEGLKRLTIWRLPIEQWQMIILNSAYYVNLYFKYICGKNIDQYEDK